MWLSFLSSIVTRRQNNSQETATFFKELQLLVGMTSLMNVRDSLNLDAGRVWWNIRYGVHREILSFTFWCLIVNCHSCNCCIKACVSQIVKFKRIAAVGGDDVVVGCRWWISKIHWTWSSLTKNCLRCSLRNLIFDILLFVINCIDMSIVQIL